MARFPIGPGSRRERLAAMAGEEKLAKSTWTFCCLNLEVTLCTSTGSCWLKLVTWHHLTARSGFPVAQLVKNPPAMWETWVQSLGWKDPLEEGMTTRSSILAWRISVDRGARRAIVHGVAKSQTQLSN